MPKRDFMDVSDYSTGEVRALIQEAIAIKATPAAYIHSLEGKALAMIFEKPSLRTRVTFDVGIHQLGGFSVYLSPAEINLGKRESAPDVARNLERMVQGIMVRTFSHKIALQLAEYAGIPVINGLTDFSHPCQAMADYLTVLECKKRLEGLKLAFIGDGNNVAHSLIHGGLRLGVHVAVGTPPSYEPNPQVVQWAKDNSGTPGARLELTHDPAEAVHNADVVYTDVWTSMGQESESARRLKMFQPYQVDEKLFSQARADAIFMHCLPAHRGEEVTDAVIDSPRSVVFQQAENRLHAQKSIMLYLMK
jgi:ornithine carbamoyltransferase